MNVSVQPTRIVRSVLTGLLLVFFFLLPLYARSLYESYTNLVDARTAVEKADVTNAVNYFARAIRWRGVFNPFANQALESLLTFSENLPDAEKVVALKELRRALFASRSFYSAGAREDALVEKITTELERLGARKPSPVKVEPLVQISYFFQFSSQIGFWGWIISVLLLIFSGFTSEGKVIKRSAVVFSTFAIFFFVFWLISLSFAS